MENNVMERSQKRKAVKTKKRRTRRLLYSAALLAGTAALLCIVSAATFGKDFRIVDAAHKDQRPQMGNSLNTADSIPVNGAELTEKVQVSSGHEAESNAEQQLIHGKAAELTGKNQKTKSDLPLVNPWNQIPKDYQVTLKQLKNGQAVDQSCYPDLQQMMDDCRKAALSPVICSSYRTQEKQERLFTNNVNKLKAKGYSQKDAETETAKSIAVPGTSEHQLGLAVDIVDVNNQRLDSSQEETAVQKWLMENSWEYGFILRYPSGKSELTGIIYEPWHYRYVGKEAAKYIYEHGICLEEYMALSIG